MRTKYLFYTIMKRVTEGDRSSDLHFHITYWESYELDYKKKAWIDIDASGSMQCENGLVYVKITPTYAPLLHFPVVNQKFLRLSKGFVFRRPFPFTVGMLV